MSSSSAAIISSAVGVPCPISTLPSFTDAVLSAWMTSHESTAVWSNGPIDAYGSTPADFDAFALIPAPTAENATISAPPPFRNVVRENSFLSISVMVTSHPSPSQRQPSGSPSEFSDTSHNDTDDHSSPCGSAPRSDASSSPTDRRPGSSFRSGNNRNAAPAHRSTPAATDATQPEPQQPSHATTHTTPANPRAS